MPDVDCIKPQFLNTKFAIGEDMEPDYTCLSLIRLYLWYWDTILNDIYFMGSGVYLNSSVSF